MAFSGVGDWYQCVGATISTPCVHDGLVYIPELAGYMHCLDAKSGQRYWEHDFKATVWGSAYYVDGKVYVGDRWMQESMLFSGYKSVMNSEATKKRMESALARPEDVKAVLDVYAATPYPKGIWAVVWSEEFNSWLKETLQNFVTEDGDIAGTIEEINGKINDLNRKYKIG